MIKNRLTQNLINLGVFAICILLITLGLSSINVIDKIKENLSTTIEQTWREQARRTLGDLKDQVLTGIANSEINPKNNESVQKWAKTSLNGVRNGGKTSDGFMLRMPKLEMVWDGSSDCSINDSSVALRCLDEYGKLFRDPKSLEKTVKEMNKYYSTKDGDNNSWKFDDSPEFLEWVMLPSDTKGFSNESVTQGGIINPNYTSFLIALGTQKDEVFAPYESTFNLLDEAQTKIRIFVTFASVVCFFNLIVYVFWSRRNYI